MERECPPFALQRPPSALHQTGHRTRDMPARNLRGENVTQPFRYYVYQAVNEWTSGEWVAVSMETFQQMLDEIEAARLREALPA